MKIKVETEEKIRIDKYLSSYLDISRNSIEKMIKNGSVFVNGKEVGTSFKVKDGDEIEYDENFNEEINIEGENIPLDIIYEDDDLMVINKPSGLVVHPGSGNKSGTLVNGLIYYTNNLSDINGESRPGIVHRIDKDTSGLMIVAKNNKTHEKLSDMLSKHEIKRDYIALIKGEFNSDTATIDAPIGREPQNRIKMAVTPNNSKNAITHLKVLKKYKGYTLVRLSLETGRTHQIRVHLSYIGYPIYNDPLYNSDEATSFGQFLHSAYLDFIHPTTNKELHFEVPLPKEFEDFLNTLEEKK